MADKTSTLSLKGSATAPSGLVARVAEEYNSDDIFFWDGDESGVDFGVSSGLTKSNINVASYYLRGSGPFVPFIYFCFGRKYFLFWMV
jgi:hypothetical protein